MRAPPLLLASLACAAGCADRTRPLLFPLGAADAPIIQEQAPLALCGDGDLMLAELIVAEDEPARLAARRLRAADGRGTLLAAAAPSVAAAVATRLLEKGKETVPLLGPLVKELFPAAAEAAFGPGCHPLTLRAAAPLPLRGASPARVPLVLATVQPASSVAAVVILHFEQENDPQVELIRMPLSGSKIQPQVALAGSVAWMLLGSVRGGGGGEPLQRTVGVRRADLGQGEARLHLLRSRALAGRGDEPGALRELALALSADPLSVEALHASAALSARAGKAEAALSLLRRAAAVDLRRLQVLGRNDPDLRSLRGRPEVDELLGSPAP